MPVFTNMTLVAPHSKPERATLQGMYENQIYIMKCVCSTFYNFYNL